MLLSSSKLYIRSFIDRYSGWAEQQQVFSLMIHGNNCCYNIHYNICTTLQHSYKRNVRVLVSINVKCYKFILILAKLFFFFFLLILLFHFCAGLVVCATIPLCANLSSVDLTSFVKQSAHNIAHCEIIVCTQTNKQKWSQQMRFQLKLLMFNTNYTFGEVFLSQY